MALTWSLPIIFAAFFFMGTSIGFVSTSGLTLLQASAADNEMGRVNSAHQFVRTLCITYGVAVGGAILLLVVDRQTGDVEAVRDVLGGEDVRGVVGHTRCSPGRPGLGARVQHRRRDRLRGSGITAVAEHASSATGHGQRLTENRSTSRRTSPSRAAPQPPSAR